MAVSISKSGDGLNYVVTAEVPIETGKEAARILMEAHRACLEQMRIEGGAADADARIAKIQEEKTEAVLAAVVTNINKDIPKPVEPE
jgi:hypothetical protein